MEILAAPSAFNGSFADFYKNWIEPNLPMPSRVAVFDALLRSHFEQEDPLLVVRCVNPLKRGVVYRTKQGLRLLPTDNAPVWWIHSRLLHASDRMGEKDLPRSSEFEDYLARMPTHFFEVRRERTLNSAGFHAAHILNAKDGNTKWQEWSRNDLEKRMLLNIHPCNMFLVAKTDWQRNGGRPDLIAWILDNYRSRYGKVMQDFLRRFGYEDEIEDSIVAPA